jgi:hypothetical protein
MATFNVYDSVSGTTKSVSVDISSSVVNGQHTGESAVFITVSINARDPRGGPIPSIILTDADISSDITSAVNGAVVELFRYAAGDYLDEQSSSSTELETSSSRTQSSVTSGMSNSSSSTRRQGSSSSVSSQSSSLSSIT